MTGFVDKSFIFGKREITMTIKEYLTYFEDVLQHPEKHKTYQDADFYNYTKLNWSRMNRWLKRFEPAEDLKLKITNLNKPQRWIIITEPWCGDAAHSVPQLIKLAELNPKIEIDIQLRDSSPFLINDYLTDGGKSIPKLVVREENDVDRFVWGPRPDVLQQIFEEMKVTGVSFDEIKTAFQKWYNEDKGAELQKEILFALDKLNKEYEY